MHAGHAFRARQPDGFGAGGEHEDVVRDGPRLGVQFAVGGAHAQDLAPQPEFDVEGGEVDVEGGALGLAEQHGLGQGRPVVRLVELGADEGDGAGEAPFAQGDRGLHTGHARAGDDHAPRL
jgi:hypothetical protein